MDQVAVLRDFHLADGEAHYRRLRELLPGHDLVVLHGIHVLAHAAVLDVGLPWATAVFDPVLLPTRSAPPPGMPTLGPVNCVPWCMLDRVLARTGARSTRSCRAPAAPQRGLPLFRARSPLLHLVACSPAIMRVPPDLPAGTRVTGAWLDDSPVAPLPSEVDAFLADGAAPMVDRLRLDVRRVRGRARRRVRRDPRGRSPGRRPGRRRRGRRLAQPAAHRAVDHRALFARAALVVHHGGSGTTHAVCAAGRAVAGHPAAVGDQRYWADRLQRLGGRPGARALPRSARRPPCRCGPRPPQAIGP